MSALEQLFAVDVTSMSDGNGATRVSRRPVAASTEGIDHVLWMVNPEKIAAVSVPA